MKNLVFLISSLVILLSSCQPESKFERLMKEGAKEIEAYIEAFDNAQSIYEVRQIRNELRNWENNYWDVEIKKIELEISITEKQKFMQDEYFNSLKERLKEAERNARRRFNN